MSKIIRTRKPSVLPYYAAALVFVVLCAVLPVYRLWALAAALAAAAAAFLAAKKVCPPRVVETEVPFHTGVEDVDAMLAALTGEPIPAREDIDAKKQLILRHGLALWDTLESCTITGASDASIKDVVPNDIAALLAKAPIEAVFCNGATAYRIYTKYLQPVTGLAAVKLPSTSPANAACRPEMLRQVWGTALADWIAK